jgi:predicted dehydrogenase
VRIAILGCGSIGRRHLANLLDAGHRDLLVYEPDPIQLADVHAAHGVSTTAALEKVWQWRPDAIVIAAPPSSHIPLALAAVERGVHLLIEKPLSHSLEHVAHLAEEVRRRDLIALIGCNMRFHPGPATVKQLIVDGAIGAVIAARLQTGSYLPDWRPAQDYRLSYTARAEEGGAILDCIHEIDLALWYAGPGRLSAAVVRPATSLGLSVDGLAELLIEHESGAVTSVHLNFVQRDYRRACQIIGATGTIYWDFVDRAVTVRRGEGMETFAEPHGWQLNQMYVDEVLHFVECVSSGKRPIAPLSDGIAALEIAVAARNGTHRVGGRKPS